MLNVKYIDNNFFNSPNKFDYVKEFLDLYALKTKIE